MQLDNIAVALRPRSNWEAIDLGFAMVQQWARPVFAAWLAVYVPAVLIVSVLCWSWPTLGALILWWLKPAFERVVLHVLANATFGQIPSLKATLRALPSLWWNRGLLAALTYQRLFFLFFLSRSFHLPVTQLEQGRGAAARQRRSVLGREGGGASMILTVICAHAEMAVLGSLYAVLFLIIPVSVDFQFSWAMLFDPEAAKSTQYLSMIASAIAVSVIEPFYVAAGFALYLHSRTSLEGWDVELAFKRMSDRIRAAASRTAAVAMVALLAVTVVGHHDAAQAATTPSDSPSATQSGTEQADDEADSDEESAESTAPADTDASSDDAEKAQWVGLATPNRGVREALNNVLASPEFGRYKDDWKIKYIGPRWERDDTEKPKARKHWWLEALARFIAESARALAWLGLAVLVGLVLYLVARQMGLRGWGRASTRQYPDVLFGLDIRPESLPDDIAAAAHAFLRQGNVRAAVGLLYRAALVALIQDGRVEIARGDTEGECVSAVAYHYRDSATGMARAAYFARLVALWQRVAYAKDIVARAEIEPVIDGWAGHFSLARADRADTPKRQQVAA